MDRNTLLAFALSMLVFIGYVSYQEQRRSEMLAEAERQARQLATEEGISADAAVEGQVVAEGGEPDRASPPSGDAREVAKADAEATVGEAAASAEESATGFIPRHETTLRNDRIVAVISNAPAMIESWKLLDFMEYVPEGEIPIDLVEDGFPVLVTSVKGVPGADFTTANFEVVSESERAVTQVARNASGRLTRTLRIDESGYGFDLELEFESRWRDGVDASFDLRWPAAVSEREDFKQISLIAYSEDEGVTRSAVPGVGQPGIFGFGGAKDGIERVEGPVRWAGFDIQYFVGVVIDPAEIPRLNVVFEAIEPRKSAEAEMTLPSVSLGSGAVASESLRGFFGPKAPEALATANHGLAHSVNRGWSWLEPLTRLFEIALDWLYALVPNYGVAIILLTILVRIFTAPLMAKQMRSSERMRALQPQLAELKERYKDDPRKQSEETMKLYRQEGVNPISGCLPLLFQFPVLIGLFYSLRSSIALRHAPFALWITDLSQPATLFVLPGVDLPVRILPLIMAGSMYVQQKMTPTTGMDPAQARMMQIMMPGMMLLFSYTFPSGLVLYWTVSNLLGIAQQIWIRKHTEAAS
ncbi:MAG TPA: membrane protein insertase YidC [Deltaproteobacteria bacterium]|nr:membrane protein insertase YidC [Deltaproteobacteria bacterium]